MFFKHFFLHHRHFWSQVQERKGLKGVDFADMAKLGSPKRILMLSMGITLYIIMVALLMFYIEECSIDNKTPPSQSRSDSRQIREQCKLIYASFQANSGTARADFNVSFEGCAKIVRSIAAKPDTRESTCRFNIINFFPWIHCVVFSFMTIGELFLITAT